jgi:prepilin-type N-terminal cleavage/methylation domain-containing protein
MIPGGTCRLSSLEGSDPGRQPGRTTHASGAGFTIVEMLVVLVMIGLLASITLPAMKGFGKSNAMTAAQHQLLADVSFARQRAIAGRTTVYMVFVPPEYWTNAGMSSLSTNAAKAAERLLTEQFTSYALVTLRSVGDQPGRPIPRYLTPWRSLPESVMIAPQKFRSATLSVIPKRSDPTILFAVNGFEYTNSIPFPIVEGTAPYPRFSLPYIAFDSQGRVTSGRDEFIPLASGSVFYGRDNNGNPAQATPDVLETPLNNWTNNYNLVHIDWLTGRARIERLEVQ